MTLNIQTEIEKTFWSLPVEERNAIISHGTALRLSDLRNRLFLAVNKVQHFEEKYEVSLTHLDAEGLPDDADYEMHEEYILWHHWTAVAHDIEKDIVSLTKIAQQGVYLPERERSDAGI